MGYLVRSMLHATVVVILEGKKKLLIINGIKLFISKNKPCRFLELIFAGKYLLQGKLFAVI